MDMELHHLRQLDWEGRIAERIQEADENGQRYLLEKVMPKEEYKAFKNIDPELISDKELFED